MRHDSCWIRRGAVLAVCVLAVACGGGGGGSGASPVVPDAPPPATKAEALVPADADGLLAHVRDRLKASREGALTAGGGANGVPVAAVSIAAPAPTSSGGDASGGSASSTVVQEAGVDEDDVVRIDGDTVWALSPPAPGGQRLSAFRVAAAGTRLDPVGSVVLDPTMRFDGLYVDAARSRVIAVGQTDWSTATPMPLAMTAVPFGAMPSAAALVFVDASNPANPRVATQLRFDGSLQASRLADGRLWLVLRSQPRFDGFDWSWGAPAANERWLANLSAEAMLPTVSIDAQPARPLIGAGDCLLQPAAPGGFGTVTSVVAIDVAAPDAKALGRCVATPVDTVYMTRDALYLATTRGPAVSGDPRFATMVAFSGEPMTDLHRFVLSTDAITYRGSGSVAGRLGSGPDTARFMLSADGPRLRVLTQRSGSAAAISPAQLTILEDRGDATLHTVSSLPNARRPEPIGKPGEQVHGVRFVGTRAYAVTFRRTDPVYVLELADPADPKLLGALEVPGFSDRLYPLGERLLLGVGHDTLTWRNTDLTTGVLVSLIDVTDPTRPIERARRVIGQRGSRSASDVSPHGTMIREVGGRFRIALPVSVNEGPIPYTVPSMPDAAQWRAFSRLAAFRFEVDPAAPALAERAPVLASGAAGDGGTPPTGRSWPEADYDRAVDIGDTTWLWFDGRFTSGAW